MTPADARTLLARLLRSVAPEIDLTGLPDDMLLQDELDIDSMDFLNLVTALHDQTGIAVPERDYPELATLGGFVAYVARVVP
jgi:acyl carrier protein